MTFNDAETVLSCRENRWPTLIKREQGGSGARMYLLHSAGEFRRLFVLSHTTDPSACALPRDRPDIWAPDNPLLLQEYFPVNPSRGMMRMEFLGGELLYAMRVISHGAFNLCPSEVCNPETGDSQCAVPAASERNAANVPSAPVEFLPYAEAPAAAVEAGKKLMEAGGLDVGGVEYLEAEDGQLIFFDINADSNLGAPIARAFGFKPFERVVDFLTAQIAAAGGLCR